MKRFFIFFNTLLICIWGICVVLSGNYYLTEESLKIIYFGKHVSPIILIIIITFMKIKNKNINNIFVFAGIFPVYTALMIMNNEIPYFNLIVLYFLWWYLIYYASNNLFLYVKRETLKYLFFSLLITEIYLVILGLLNERVFWFNGNIVFAMKNPNFFGDLAAICSILSIYLLRINKIILHKLFYLITFTFNFILTLYSQSISSVVLLFSILLYLWLQNFSGWKKFGLVILFAFLFCVTFVWAIYQPFDNINALSSGRLKIWEMNIEHNLKSEFDWLFGNSTMEVVGYPQGNFDNSVQVEHIDNSYLEILIRYGLVGFSLFFSALLIKLYYLKISFFRNILSCDIIFSKAVIIAILLQGLYETNFPSVGNLMNILLLLSIGNTFHREGEKCYLK